MIPFFLILHFYSVFLDTDFFIYKNKYLVLNKFEIRFNCVENPYIITEIPVRETNTRREKLRIPLLTPLICLKTYNDEYNNQIHEVSYNGNKFYINDEYTIKFEPDFFLTCFLRIFSGNHRNWNLPIYHLPNDEELAKIPAQYLSNRNKSEYLEKNALANLINMFDNAKQQRINIKVVRGYKDYYEQSIDYAFRQSNYLLDPRLTIFDKPTYSLNHLGTVIDVSVPEIDYELRNDFSLTKAYGWLKENAKSFGYDFISGAKEDYENGYDARPFKLIFLGKKHLETEQEISNSSPDTELDGNRPFERKVIFYDKIAGISIKRGMPNGIKYLVIHDNENASSKVLDYAIRRFGGEGFELFNYIRRKREQRNVFFYFKHYNKYYSYEVDPNRIFSEEGIWKTLKHYNWRKYNSMYRAVMPLVKEIANFILNTINWQKHEYLIAIHTNLNAGGLDIDYFTNYPDNYLVHINEKHDKDHFIITVKIKDYEYFKKLNYNVVLQKENVINDGSLSYYSTTNDLNYISLEVQHGYYTFQKRMIVDVINYVYGLKY